MLETLIKNFKYSNNNKLNYFVNEYNIMYNGQTTIIYKIIE